MAIFHKSLLNLTIYFNSSKRYFFKVCAGKSKVDRSKLKDKIPKNFEKEDEHKQKLRETKLKTEDPDATYLLDDIPQEMLQTRTARIFQPPKNAMQSAAYNTKHWLLDFDTKERWENPNIGWCSSGDALSNIHMKFSSKEEAINYCERAGWKWTITKRNLKKKYERKRTYAQNFVDKRCRVSTK